MITAGTFHRHQAVVKTAGRQYLPDLSNRPIQTGAVVFDDGWRDDDVAVEVTQHPFGPGLGTIDTDNAEVLGPYLLHPRVDDPARFLQDLLGPGSRPFATASRSHGHASKKRVRDNPILLDGSPEFSGFLYFFV